MPENIDNPVWKVIYDKVGYLTDQDAAVETADEIFLELKALGALKKAFTQ